MKRDQIPRCESLPKADRIPGAQNPRSRPLSARSVLLHVLGGGHVMGIASSREPGAPSDVAVGSRGLRGLREAAHLPPGVQFGGRTPGSSVFFFSSLWRAQLRMGTLAFP